MTVVTALQKDHSPAPHKDPSPCKTPNFIQPTKMAAIPEEMWPQRFPESTDSLRHLDRPSATEGGFLRSPAAAAKETHLGNWRGHSPPGCDQFPPLPEAVAWMEWYKGPILRYTLPRRDSLRQVIFRAEASTHE